jgi:putative ABC transport system ATP-binding protein
MSEARQAVETRGLTRVFSTGPTRVEALRGIDLSVRPGEFVAIMGPSGSGKSTLLHLVCGLDQPTTGQVLFEGQDLARLDDQQLTLLRRRRLGIVFQAFNLIEVLSVVENVALPLGVDGLSEGVAQTRAREVLRVVEMQHRAGFLPGQLSGGEQQRVAIARALVTRPALVLADEPTGNLDSTTGDQILDLLRRLVDEQGQTLLLVTHNARQAARADRLLCLRDGRIVEEQALRPSRPLSQVLGELVDTPEE